MVVDVMESYCTHCKYFLSKEVHTYIANVQALMVSHNHSCKIVDNDIMIMKNTS